jgi:hypothetical protein
LGNTPSVSNGQPLPASSFPPSSSAWVEEHGGILLHRIAAVLPSRVDGVEAQEAVAALSRTRNTAHEKTMLAMWSDGCTEVKSAIKPAIDPRKSIVQSSMVFQWRLVQIYDN